MERRREEMERYLTKKCRPGKGIVLLENAAMIVGFGLFAACVVITALMLATLLPVAGIAGLSLRNFLLLIPAVLLVLALNALGERMRARKHARVIVAKLQQADGCIPADEAESVIGVRKAADTAMALVSGGYLTEVRMEQGYLLLGDAEAPQSQKEEPKQLFRDAEV